MAWGERDVALLLEFRCTYVVLYGAAVVRLGEWRFTKIDTGTPLRTYRRYLVPVPKSTHRRP